MIVLLTVCEKGGRLWYKSYHSKMYGSTELVTKREKKSIKLSSFLWWIVWCFSAYKKHPKFYVD